MILVVGLSFYCFFAAAVVAQIAEHVAAVVAEITWILAGSSYLFSYAAAETDADAAQTSICVKQNKFVNGSMIRKGTISFPFSILFCNKI